MRPFISISIVRFLSSQVKSAAESPDHLLPERATTGTIRVLPLAKGERYLGVCFSPRLDTAVTEE
jgi:hypothetical protein